MDCLQELQDLVKKFVSNRNWEKFHNPKNLAMSICIESAEIMELFQWMTIEESKVAMANEEHLRKELAFELADVLIYCISLANVTNIDLCSAVKEKMSINENRFPANSSL